jgi:hypothetical protein
MPDNRQAADRQTATSWAAAPLARLGFLNFAFCRPVCLARFVQKTDRSEQPPT